MELTFVYDNSNDSLREILDPHRDKFIAVFFQELNRIGEHIIGRELYHSVSVFLACETCMDFRVWYHRLLAQLEVLYAVRLLEWNHYIKMSDSIKRFYRHEKGYMEKRALCAQLDEMTS